ncbi:MAG: glutaminase [Pseudomonadota bacterium]
MDYQKILDEIERDIVSVLGTGKVADYIPALACADPRAFAIAVIDNEGRRYSAGAAQAKFSIQSISKVFTLSLALGFEGGDLWRRVGREPSGTAFNSIVQLEKEQGVPRNPFINAGALVVTDAIMSNCASGSALKETLGFINRAACVGSIDANAEVAESEKQWGDRNRSLAYFMKSFGILENPVEDVLDAYFSQCSIEMSVEELACAGLYLANDGTHPLTGEALSTHDRVNRVNAIMLTCGHYDRSGDFAFRVGLPGKSGVGGGILAIAPGACSVAVWSPALNEAGNSLAGAVALEMFSEKTGLNIF